jgi:FMN reductase [NAD(P)H]
MGDYSAELHDRFGPSAPADADAPDSTFLHQVLRRRTHRSYAPRPVPSELVRILCLTALSASAKSDFQQATIIEVTDPQSRATLAAPFPDMPHIGTSPVFLVFCGDARRLERISTLRGHPQTNGNLEGFFNATVDAALALQTCILAAESLGLGCCPISVLRNHAGMVGEVLKLPEKVFPVAGLCLGWPAAPGFISMRLPPAITLHKDRYDDTRLPELIDAYDRARDARFSIPRDKQRAPDAFGYAEFYGWSEDKARQAARPEGAAFPPWLRAQNFTFDQE